MATSLDREDIIKKKSTSVQAVTENTIALVSTFDPSYTNPIRKINHIVNDSCHQVSFFKNIKIINSSRQSPNLKLTLALSNNNGFEEPKVFKCNLPRCKCCLQLITGSHDTLNKNTAYSCYWLSYAVEFKTLLP